MIRREIASLLKFSTKIFEAEFFERNLDLRGETGQGSIKNAIDGVTAFGCIGVWCGEFVC